MAKTPAPERITHQGQEMVLVTPEEYAALSAARRQAGAQSNRLRMMSHELRETIGVLTAVEAHLTGGQGRYDEAELLRRVRTRMVTGRDALGRNAPR